METASISTTSFINGDVNRPRRSSKSDEDTSDWPLADPLPSYGRGRERQEGRDMSFILGDGVHDVTITGENGTINGQGGVWWNMWRRKTLQYTRPHLIEFMHSTHISISNVVFKNSPFWNIHPVYCRCLYLVERCVNAHGISFRMMRLLR